MTRSRTLALALIGLVTPLPALALAGSENATSEPQTLSVAASLDRCGTADAQIVCKIDTSWNAIDGADEYAVSVVRADGSVVEYGDGGVGGTSLWVPYVGPGSYAVQVIAYGTPPGEDEPEVIALDQALSAQQDDAPQAAAAPGGSRELHGAGGAAGGQATPPTAADETPPAAADPGAPACEDPRADESRADVPQATRRELEATGLGAVSRATEAALEAEGELPEEVACP